MKNTSSQIKNSFANKKESPKTPGGISKSLLTPCRRVGLSRNWKSKGTVSPFISPLGTSNDTENETRKRKKDCIEKFDQSCDSNTSETQLKEDLILSCNTPTSTLSRTPSRSLLLKKKSKTLLLTPDNDDQNENEQVEIKSFVSKYDSEQNNSICSKEPTEVKTVQIHNKVSKLLTLKTKNKTTNKVLEVPKEKLEDQTLIINNNINNLNEIEIGKNKVTEKKEEKSPNNLTRECIFVIQNKILKNIHSNNIEEKCCSNKDPVSTFCESDNDDIPLYNLGSKEDINRINSKSLDVLVDSGNSVKKIDKTTSVTDLKTKTKIKEKKSDKNNKFHGSKTSSQSSNSFDDDYDDDFQMDKRTILIKKSYSKLAKPSKAKSTGSISQNDIDELRARIEKKKNLLMVKAMSNETEELRGLIKKWQQGCQIALTELLELMKREMPGQSMDYSEILKMLKIPSDLVGYDSESDCFITPDDKNILLSGFNLNKI